MVAFSRRCRRFVRRRDKVTLAIRGPPISRQILVGPLTVGDGSCVKLAQRKNPPCGKKKAAAVYILIHPRAGRSLAKRVRTCCLSRKIASTHRSRESNDAVRPVHDALAPAGAGPL